MFNPDQYGVGTPSVNLLQDSETSPRAMFAQTANQQTVVINHGHNPSMISVASDGTVVLNRGLSNESLLSDVGNTEMSVSPSSTHSALADTPMSMDRPPSNKTPKKERSCELLE